MGFIRSLPGLVAASSLAACGGGGGSASPPVPTASLAAASTTIDSGGTTGLTWSSTNATACTASDGWNGALAANGAQDSGVLSADTTFTLTCTGAGGTSVPAVVTVTVVPLPTAQLSVDTASLANGAAATLTWSSTDATACIATGDWSGALAPAGTQSTGPLTASRSYSLACTGTGGSSAVATVLVSVAPAPEVVIAPPPSPPTATLGAAPATVANGAAATLTWASTNATACVAAGAWTGALGTAGTQTTGPVTAATTYSLTCTGPGGTSAAATTVVNVTPTVALHANPTVVASGGTSTLAWTSTAATDCTAAGGWAGAKAASGTEVTAALTATAAYSLTCNGPGGASAVATATVTLSNATASVLPSIVALTVSQTQQFTAAVPGGGNATWTVDGVAGGNAAVGLISATGLFTAGTTAGTHTIAATSIANTSVTATAVAAVTDLGGVYTYHNNLARDGSNTKEYALTKATVTTGRFGKVAACPVDGAIYGQPLWAANLAVNGAKHNVAFVATQHDGLYAFDADASPCAKLWSANLIDVAHGGAAGETPVPAALVGVGAGDIQPEIGITGTPVIDPATGILYVVTKSIDAAKTTYFQRVHAIDIATGNEKAGSPLLITGSYPGTGTGGTSVAFDTHQHLQRTGLALFNGIVYVAFTAHEDKDPWYGWMMSYQYVPGAGFTQKAIINVAPNRKRGGIWMSGGAPAADSNNKLYVITGNGDFNATSTTAPNNDYGDSLLQLTPTLTVSQWFTPSAELFQAQHDLDFGSGGAAILAELPAGNTVTHALICGGKDQGLFVLNRDMLGGYSDPVAVQKINFGARIFATGAFWNNSFYLAGVSGPLQHYALNTANAQFTQTSSSTHIYGFAGATPSVSSAGAQNGIVWTLETGQYCTHQSKACGPVVLFAHDATNMKTELWNSSLAPADAAGYAIKFTLPTVANGKVYVGTRGNNVGGENSTTSVPGELDIYGLKP